MAQAVPHATVVQRALREVLEHNRRSAISLGQAAAVWPFIQVLDAGRYTAWRKQNDYPGIGPARLARRRVALLLWPLAPSALAPAIKDHVITELVSPLRVESLPVRTAPDLAVTYVLIRWLRQSLEEHRPMSLGTPVAELRSPTGRRRVFALDLFSGLYAPDMTPATEPPETAKTGPVELGARHPGVAPRASAGVA